MFRSSFVFVRLAKNYEKCACLSPTFVRLFVKRVDIENTKTKLKTENSKLTQPKQQTTNDDATLTNVDTKNAKTNIRPKKSNLKILLENGFSEEVINKNLWLLTTTQLSTKIDFIKKMHPQDINHFVGFLSLNYKRLRLMLYLAQKEADTLPNGYKHRVYYFSDKLNASPDVIIERFLKNKMMFSSIQRLIDCLEILQRYGVKNENILRDLGAFKQSVQKIESRLNRIKSAGLDNLMPWMLRCSEPIFERLIQKTIGQRELLGNSEDFGGFLIKYLEIDQEKFNELLTKYPRLSEARPLRIKPILDYIIDEKGFTKDEIVNTPSILFFKIDTLKRRFNEYESAHGKPPPLTQLIQGEKRFKRYVGKNAPSKEIKTSVNKNTK